jgi:hypothetical protein
MELIVDYLILDVYLNYDDDDDDDDDDDEKKYLI